MNLGEKLQRLRKKSGLSQEHLATQLTVSRQAVSKWELNETMPDTENVIQVSRIFNVTCDYLLREEVADPSASLPPWDVPQPVPAAPEEARLTERGWVHTAFTLSLAVCIIGLVAAYMCRINGHTPTGAELLFYRVSACGCGCNGGSHDPAPPSGPQKVKIALYEIPPFFHPNRE